MRRSIGKFILLTVAVALLVYLILVQQAISRALVLSFNGAIHTQSAPVLVYATDALRSPQGSVLPPPLQEAVEANPAVAEAARIGITSVTLPSAALAEGELTATLWGAEDADLGGVNAVDEGRLAEADGEAVGTLGDFEIGEIVTVEAPDGASSLELEIVGLVRGAQLNVVPVLYVSYTDFEESVMIANPSAPMVLPNLMAVVAADDAAEAARGLEGSELTDADWTAMINSLREESTDLDPITKDHAANDFPGVAPVESSFLIILGLFGFVVPLVTGLFFLIITFQKSRALTLLRAIGARSGVLVKALLTQVLIVLGGGIALGTALYAATTLIEIGTLTLTVSWGEVAFWAALLLGLGVLSSLAAVRRVLAIDPVEATTAAGGR